jgi:tight adherence protein B
VTQIGIFIAVTIGSLSLLSALGSLWQPGRNRVRRRLAGEFKGGSNIAPGPLYKDLDALDIGFVGNENYAAATDEIAASLTPSRHWRSRLEVLLRQSGLAWTTQQLIWITVGASLVFACIGLGFVGWLGAVAGSFLGAVCVFFFLMTKRNVRRERYLKQLVGAFEFMARVLRAGQAVPEAFRSAVNAFEEPLSSEFERCLHQIEHGLRPEAAFRELSQRSGILELRIFVVAMTIQRQSGGNLSEVLDRLAVVIRNRVRVRQKIKALTAEGRLQALTLVVLPIITFFVMYFLNRQYAEMLLEHTRLLAATGVCMAVGVLWIRNIMNFEG